MKYFVLLLLLSSRFWLSAQTTVILVKKQNEIFVGADSRISFPNSTYVADSICKISISGKYYFAIAGPFPDESRNAAIYSCLTSKTPQELLDNYEEKLRSEIAPLLNNSQIVNDYLNRGGIITITFFGFEDKKPFAVLSQTKIILGITAARFQTIRNKEMPLVTFIGHKDAISKYEIQDTSKWNGDVSKKIEALIKTQSKKDSLSVGGPVDIIRVTSKEYTWKRLKKICK